MTKHTLLWTTVIAVFAVSVCFLNAVAQEEPLSYEQAEETYQPPVDGPPADDPPVQELFEDEGYEPEPYFEEDAYEEDVYEEAPMQEDAPYEVPEDADLVLETDKESLEESVEALCHYFGL